MWEYTNKVQQHFLHPQNVGEIENPDGTGDVGSLACGDALKLTLRIDENKIITDAKFKTFGCASAIASSSVLTEMVKGMSIDDAAKITNEDIAEHRITSYNVCYTKLLRNCLASALLMRQRKKGQ